MSERGHQFTESDDEENEEVFILDEDPDQEPTEEEIFGYAQFLGFDIENDDDLIYIAYEALQQPLPSNWKRAYLKNSNRMCYIDLTSEQFHMYSPIDEEAMHKYDALRKQKTKKKGAAIPPKTKGLPPLGKEGKEEKPNKLGTKSTLEGPEKLKKEDEKEKEKKKKGKKKTKKEEKQLEYKNKEEKFIEEDNDIKEEISIRREEKEKPLQKMPDYSPINNVLCESANFKEIEQILEEDSNKPKMFDNKDHDFLDRSENKQTFDDIMIQNNYKKEDSKINSTSMEKESKIKGNDKYFSNMERTSDKNTIDSKTNEKTEKTILNTKNQPAKDVSPVRNDLIESSSSSVLENQRRKYFNDKMQEVKQFELQLKEKYKSDHSLYKDKKAQLKAELQEFYENEVEKQSELMEKEFNTQLQSTLTNLEIMQKSEIKLEISGLLDKLEKEKSQFYDKKDQTETKLNNLMKEKSEILGDIEFYSRLHENTHKTIDLTEQEISEGRYLLEDKFNVEMKNIERKYENLEKEIYLEEEMKFNKEVENIQRTVNANIEKQEKTFKTFFGKILDDYQKALDEDFQIQAKAIVKEADDRLLSEFLRKTSEFERDYFNEISTYRENLKILNDSKDNFLEKKFENIIKTYENLKREIITKIEDIVENLLRYLKDIKSQDEFETKFEEYVLYYLDVNNLASQRKKNSYDLLEVEYKEKSVSLDYFLEIGAEIIKTFRECNIKNDNFMLNRNIWDNDKLYDELYKITKEKQKKFKEKFYLIKEKKIFDFDEQKKLTKNNFYEKSFKHTGFSELNFNKSLIQSVNNNNPYTFKNENSGKSDIRTSSEYIPLLYKNDLKLNNDRDLVNTEMDFKKSTNLEGFKKTERYHDKNDLTSSKINFFKSSSGFNQRNNNNVTDIIQKFEDPVRTHISLIQNFLKVERTLVEKELNDLKNEKTISESLKQVVKRNCFQNEFKETSGSFNSLKNINNSQTNYYQIMEEENEKIKHKIMKAENKNRILEKIEGYYEEFISFLRTCDLYSLSKETVEEKVKLIQSLIEDYKKNFYENNFFSERTNDQEYYTSRTKSFHDFHQVSQRDPSSTLRNTIKDQHTPETSFSNFIKFYDRTTLHNEFKLPSTNQYFNYKKSLNNIDEKLEFINTSARYKDF